MPEETLALVMTDLEDSTGGWDRNRVAFQELLEAYIDLVERRLQPPPRVEGFLGDGHVLSFPSVDAAAAAATRLRELWEQRRRTFRRPEWEAMHRLKMGIHWGRVSRRNDSRLLGNPLNICSRVLAAAEPGEILISETAVMEFDEKDRFAFGSPRAVKLKGFHKQAVKLRGFDTTKGAPGTPLYPLLGPAGQPGEAPLPDEAEQRRRRIVQGIRDEIIALWGTKAEDSSQELALARSLIALAPTDPFAHYSLGFALIVQGDRDGAEQAYREAVRLNKNYWEAHNDLGVVLADKPGGEEDAEGHFREAIKLKLGYAEAHCNLGLLLERRGDKVGAEEHFREAVRLDPGYATAHINLGLLLERRGDKVEAEEHFREAVRLDPGLHGRVPIRILRQGRDRGTIKKGRP